MRGTQERNQIQNDARTIAHLKLHKCQDMSSKQTSHVHQEHMHAVQNTRGQFWLESGKCAHGPHFAKLQNIASHRITADTQNTCMQCKTRGAILVREWKVRP